MQGTGDPARARPARRRRPPSSGSPTASTFEPRSTRGELAGRYRDADAVVFPSEWEEPFGLVPLEAMACGTPVVATGVGGSGEFLVDGVNCVRFRAGDPAALAAAVRRAGRRRGLRARLVADGFDHGAVLRRRAPRRLPSRRGTTPPRAGFRTGARPSRRFELDAGTPLGA